MTANFKVLVVDDYSTMVRIVRKLLKQIGYDDVDEASNGGMALEMIQKNSYGLIISDWNMEPMSGYDLLRHVRSNAATAQTPFILVTAESRADNVAAAKEAGANEYLVKPFSAPVLKEKIDKALAVAKAAA
ncbi:response regulator [Rhodomicrobium vannielii ATCC 17100]|jgi:two-component system chemotaxis response regulator CheY|uniref:Response regulator n=1 Tax=Rhodomicrobium udaipurense TaxID=1202716 RepID=A0A8I1GE81_9HYPH|nr:MULTISPECIES: response regulator [Rhodomicrobium]KAI95102.1 chemotaxis protein CheY [Rhodomicrobium udaipurense JA643]MBJ7535912.1 response regulator [Rhodomicrobium vannielii ATCC 17100]MBJ7542001.1 response regulator [Rhodomicrobium udaipurense]